MVVNAYSVLDSKAGFFSPPFFLIADALAMRAVIEAAQTGEVTFAKYPEDFVLYRVGQFDDNTGNLVSAPPVNLGVVAALLAQVK